MARSRHPQHGRPACRPSSAWRATARSSARELRAIERALKYFGPVLGEARMTSSRASTGQEITTVGRLTTAPDDDPKNVGNPS